MPFDGQSCSKADDARLKFTILGACVVYAGQTNGVTTIHMVPAFFTTVPRARVGGPDWTGRDLTPALTKLPKGDGSAGRVITVKGLGEQVSDLLAGVRKGHLVEVLVNLYELLTRPTLINMVTVNVEPNNPGAPPRRGRPARPGGLPLRPGGALHYLTVTQQEHDSGDGHLPRGVEVGITDQRAAGALSVGRGADNLSISACSLSAHFDVARTRDDYSQFALGLGCAPSQRDVIQIWAPVNPLRLLALEGSR
jgi:hypothetical protein